MLSAPSQRILKHETEYAIKQADMRSIAECVASAQNAAMYGETFEDLCLERYEISSQYVCMNNRYNVVSCDSETGKAPEYNFIITTSYALPVDKYNNMLEILEKYYPEAGTFGIFSGSELISASSVTRRQIPKKNNRCCEITRWPVGLYKAIQDTRRNHRLSYYRWIQYSLSCGYNKNIPIWSLAMYRIQLQNILHWRYNLGCKCYAMCG